MIFSINVLFIIVKAMQLPSRGYLPMPTSDITMKNNGHGSTFQKAELRDQGENSQGKSLESTENNLVKELPFSSPLPLASGYRIFTRIPLQEFMISDF